MTVKDGFITSGGTDEIRDLLKEKGLRFSRPRAVILSFLREQNIHITAEQLYSTLRARGEKLSLSTTYLNLMTLKKAGLIRELKGLGDETLYDSNVIDPHYHIVCDRSGKVVDIPELKIDGVPLTQYLKEKAEELTGWQVELPEIHLRGISPN